MADILEFRATARCIAQREQPSGSAEIVIFPGVRIERESFSLADRLGEQSGQPCAPKCSQGRRDD